MNQVKKVCVVLGAGPGLGGSVAVRFAKAGYRVALLSRNESSVSDAAKRIAELKEHSLFVSTDAGNEDSIRAAFDRISKELGPVDVLVYNTSGMFSPTPVLDLKGSDALDTFRLTACGFLWAAQQVLPRMIEQRQGCILVTGATSAYRANAKNANFSMAKHALKALANSMAREHGPNGVHVAHIRIDCAIDTPRAKQYMGDKYDPENLGSPDELAETYYWVSQQPRHAWSNEVELRPYKENWTC